jgi:hypothetical protein
MGRVVARERERMIHKIQYNAISSVLCLLS